MANKTSRTRASGKRRAGKMSAGEVEKAASPRARSKTATCLALLERPEGATIAELQKVTGWQSHSSRGFLAGVVKKKLPLKLDSRREERGRVYRITSKCAPKLSFR